MLNLINLCIYQTNLALSMSGTNARLRLVGTFMDFTYSDAGKSNGQIINEVKSNPLFSAVRDAYGADLVHYIGENVPTGVAANIGGDEAHGFAATRRDRAALAGDYTFAHETGHNLVSDF